MKITVRPSDFIIETMPRKVLLHRDTSILPMINHRIRRTVHLQSRIPSSTPSGVAFRNVSRLWLLFRGQLSICDSHLESEVTFSQIFFLFDFFKTLNRLAFTSVLPLFTHYLLSFCLSLVSLFCLSFFLLRTRNSI